MTTFICPKGHNSTEADYCSDCGVKIGGPLALDPPIHLGSASAAPVNCPDCSTPHEADSGKFCEICGYNFTSGAHGQLPIATVSPPMVVPPPPPLFTVKLTDGELPFLLAES